MAKKVKDIWPPAPPCGPAGPRTGRRAGPAASSWPAQRPRPGTPAWRPAFVALIRMSFMGNISLAAGMSIEVGCQFFAHRTDRRTPGTSDACRGRSKVMILQLLPGTQGLYGMAVFFVALIRMSFMGAVIFSIPFISNPLSAGLGAQREQHDHCSARGRSVPPPSGRSTRPRRRRRPRPPPRPAGRLPSARPSAWRAPPTWRREPGDYRR